MAAGFCMTNGAHGVSAICPFLLSKTETHVSVLLRKKAGLDKEFSASAGNGMERVHSDVSTVPYEGSAAPSISSETQQSGLGGDGRTGKRMRSFRVYAETERSAPA